MEVRGIGQGRQLNYSSEVNNVNTTNSENSAAANEVNTVVKVGNSDTSTSEQRSKLGKDGKFDEKDVKKAVDKLNKFMEESETYAEYSIHEKFGDTMIKIVNKNTKEVVLEVPPRKILDMVAKMCELAGVVFDRKA